MKKIFTDTRMLDRAAADLYGLTEAVLMENAAAALEQSVRTALAGQCMRKINPEVLIITGGGNNGGDGMALARRISGDVAVAVYGVKEPRSDSCRFQRNGAEKAGVQFLDENGFRQALPVCAVIVDCLYGSGFHGSLDKQSAAVIESCNSAGCFKIACDIPSGIDCRGVAGSWMACAESPIAFHADVTVTMGALKTALYGDDAKDCAGTVICANLGICRNLFESASPETKPAAFLLERTDMKLPVRLHQSVNKGCFGHAVLAVGEKPGAAVIAANAAFAFGAGLVTLVSIESDSERVRQVRLPPELMLSDRFPGNTTAVALGMGLGDPESDRNAAAFIERFKDWFGNTRGAACVIDADLCKYSRIGELLEYLELCRKKSSPRIVLTPHPKEFQFLVRLCGLGDYAVTDIVSNRFELVEKFIRKYPGTVLLLKGANSIVASWTGSEVSIYVNTFGCPCLAKAGSGDVLSGLVCALLAQGYTASDAAITGTLAHAFASQKTESSYGMTPGLLTEAVRSLQM